MPDVSVIIAARNAEQTVNVALASALAQTGVSVEVIVVDDASTDGTAERVMAFADARVRLIRLAENLGPAGARNVAIEAARGAWIAVLDADDAMEDARLATLVRIGERYGLEIVADNLRLQREGAPGGLLIEEVLDGTLEPISLARFCRANRLFQRAPAYGYLKPVFRASIFRERGVAYDTRLRIGEDFMLVAEALAQGARFGRVRAAYYTYRVGAGSTSHRLGAGDVAEMAAADDRFLARHGEAMRAEARRAMRAHARSLAEGAAFIAMVDAMKQARPLTFARLALGAPRALRHFRMPLQARARRLWAARGAWRHRAKLLTGAA